MTGNQPRRASTVFIIAMMFTVCMCLCASAQVPKSSAVSDANWDLMSQAHPDSKTIANTFGKLPLYFEPNYGQSDGNVKFLSRGSGYTVFFNSTGLVLALRSPSSDSDSNSNPDAKQPRRDSSSPTTVEMQLLQSNPAADITGINELTGKVNYIKGNSPKLWIRQIPTFQSIKYSNIYPGINTFYHGNKGHLEFDFEVLPGASPNSILLKLNGINNVEINGDGNLILKTSVGDIALMRPLAYQLSGSGRTIISSRYILYSGNRIGFEIGRYDTRKSLIIDPVLTYSTYLGGSHYDSGSAIAVDSLGSAYVTGTTNSNDFPSSVGSLDPSCGGAGSICSDFDSDVFVTKLSPDGSTLIYSTYIGGTSVDSGKGIAIDGSGNAYVTGLTSSRDFPATAGALQQTYGGAVDAFVAKLSADGSSLIYSSFLGNSGFDGGFAIALDSSGNAYITGITYSTAFPTVNPIQAGLAGGLDGDAFVAEVNASGSALVYSTYLGGSDLDRGNGIAVDATGNAYVTGFTRSSDFPIVGALQAACASCPTYADAFIAKVIAGGGSLVYSTFMGGSADDQGVAIAVDPAGSTYVTGFTYSNNFPATSGAWQTSLSGLADAFVTKLSPDGSAQLFSTYLGGGDVDFGKSIAVLMGNTYVVGDSYSNNFPMLNAIQSSCPGGSCGNGTVFVTELNAAGSAPVFSSYLGGSGGSTGGDQGSGIAVDTLGNSYLTGETVSVDFHVSNALQTKFGGEDGDAFIAKISLAPIISLSNNSITFGSQAVGTTSSAQTISVSNTGTAPTSIVTIGTTGDFNSTNTCGSALAAGSTCVVSVSYSPSGPGTGTGTLSITDGAADSPQSVSLAGSSSVGVSMSPSNLNFGSQPVGTASATQTVILNNLDTTTSLVITSISITGSNPNDFVQSGNCGSSLAAGSSCIINVVFTPTAIGSRTANLVISDTATGSPQTAVLTGLGTAAAVTLSTTNLSFSSQLVGTSSSAQGVTITNSGSATLNLNNISITGSNALDYSQANTCGSSLSSGGRCTISVSFSPKAAGTRTATLSIIDNAVDSPQSVTLSGMGFGQGVSPITPVNTWKNSGAGVSLSTPIASAAGDDVFVVVAINTTSGVNSVSSIVDNAGNSYQLRRFNTNLKSRVELWSARKVAAATSVTVNIVRSSNLSVVVADYAGVGGYGGSDTNSSTSTNPAVSNSTVTGGNWLIAAFASVGTASYSGNTGNLRGSAVSNTGSNDIGGALVDNAAPAGAQGARIVESANLSASEAWSGVVIELQAATPPSPVVQLVAGKTATGGTTTTATLSLANTVGDLLVAVVRCNASVSISSVTDTAGNTYSLAVGPTTDPGTSWKQAIYYAGNIKAQGAGNKVTVTFSSAITSANVHVMEFSQQATSSLLDVTAASAGNGTALNSGSATTNASLELLVGAGTAASGTASAGPGYAPLIYFNNVLVEQQSVATTGNYSGTETNSASTNWTMQLATWH